MIPKIEKLAIYYGYPSHVNGSEGNIEKAIKVFSAYDSIIFGANLELEKHEDHSKTKEIIHSLSNTIHMFGYINIGLTNGKLDLKEIQKRIQLWKNMGIYGIFLDAAGYDYGVTRERQNKIIRMAHDKELSVFINAFNPDDVFSEDPTPILLSNKDYYLHESFQIQDGKYVDPEFWILKSTKALEKSKPFGTKQMVTTVSSQKTDFKQDQLAYAWWSTLLLGFHGFSWGEQLFSSDGHLPFRERPSEKIGEKFLGKVKSQGHLYTRETDQGIILVDGDNHIGSFTPHSNSKASP